MRHRERRRRGPLVVVAVLLVCGVSAYGAVLALNGTPRTGSGNEVVTRILAASTPEPEPAESENDVAPGATPKAEKPAVIRPWCWSGLDAARTARCQSDVITMTRFVARYQQGQPAISQKHTEADLARHGLEVCAMSGDRNLSVLDMVIVFMVDYHAHPGPVTEQAALQVQAIALQSLCPQRRAAYAEKSDM